MRSAAFVERRRFIVTGGLAIGVVTIGLNFFVPDDFAQDQLPWMFALAPAALAATLRVDNTDPGCDDIVGDPYCTINAAIDDAGVNDLVTVGGGTYSENVVVDVDGLRLRAQGRVLIVGDGSTSVVDIVPPGAA